MKKVMMALAALCVAGAAGAVTVSWSIDTVKFAGSSQWEWLGVAFISGAVTDYSAVQVNGYNAVADGTLTLTGLPEGASVLGSNLNMYDGSNDGMVSSITHSMELDLEGVETLTILFVAPYQNQTGGSQYATYAAFALDGILVGDELALHFDEVFINGNGGAPYDGTLGATVVPEPTALALLALGAAGLALRRKAA